MLQSLTNDRGRSRPHRRAALQHHVAQGRITVGDVTQLGDANP